jgi:hypothetical protein
MRCPVCNTGAIDDFNHEVCGVCGVHFGNDDHFGGKYDRSTAHKILREAWLKAGCPSWELEKSQPGFKGGVRWLDNFHFSFLILD